MIKAVANAIPNYPMNCFKFPKKTCKELDSMLSNFWWGQKGQEGRIHWKAWEKITKAKCEGGMGFRSLELFNKALLAKSAWRVLQDPGALWVKILKGLYFPNKEFMEAGKGNKASWGWTSILEGRELLRKGLGRKIGDGRKTKVFTDRWLPSLPGWRLEERELEDSIKEIKVEDLIEGRKWNLDRIIGALQKEEVNGINGIKLPRELKEDTYVWMFAKDGEYSVKSGYKEALKETEDVRKDKPGCSYVPSKKLWEAIWKIKMPPKVVQFMWRAVSGALATKEALYKRKCSKSPMCELCEGQVETIEHMLFFCPWAKKCWFGGPLTVRIEEEGMSRLDRWLEDWMNSKDSPDESTMTFFAGLCWGIWKMRCKAVFEKTETDAWECVAGAMRLLRDQGEANERKKEDRGKEGIQMRKLKWEAPEKGKVKLNIDAAFKKDTREAAIGVVKRNETGIFLGGIGRRVKASSPFMAECLAAIEAMKHGDQVRCSKVILETDCQELYKHIRKMEVKGCEWGSVEVLEECISCWRTLVNWEIALVARKGNEAADQLAACALKDMVPQNWILQPPNSLVAILRRDQRNKEQIEEMMGNISVNYPDITVGDTREGMNADEDSEAIRGVGALRERMSGKWQKPEVGTVKINVGVAFCQENRRAAMGAVGRDWNGRYVGGIGKMLQADTYTLAECLAVKEVLQCGDIWWGGKVELETECQYLGGMLREGKSKMKGGLNGDRKCAMTVKDCLSLLQAEECRKWSVTLIERIDNNVAGCLATEIMRGLVPQGWLDQPPTSLQLLIDLDMENCMGNKSNKAGIG